MTDPPASHSGLQGRVWCEVSAPPELKPRPSGAVASIKLPDTIEPPFPEEETIQCRQDQPGQAFFRTWERFQKQATDQNKGKQMEKIGRYSSFSGQWQLQKGRWVKDNTVADSCGNSLTKDQGSAEELDDDTERQHRKNNSDSIENFYKDMYVGKIVRKLETCDIGVTQIQASGEKLDEGKGEHNMEDNSDSNSDSSSIPSVKALKQELNLGTGQQGNGKPGLKSKHKLKRNAPVKLRTEQKQPSQSNREFEFAENNVTQVKTLAQKLSTAILQQGNSKLNSDAEGMSQLKSKHLQLEHQGNPSMWSSSELEFVQRNAPVKLRTEQKRLSQSNREFEFAENNVTQVKALAQKFKTYTLQQDNSKLNSDAEGMSQLKSKLLQLDDQVNPSIWSSSELEIVQDSESITQLLYRLGLFSDCKLTTAHFLDISKSTLEYKEPSTEKELVHAFMQRLLAVDYTARQISIKTDQAMPKGPNITRENDINALFKRNADTPTRKEAHVHPMDIQMAVFLCADDFLRQVIVNKLSECQYAIPLLVPNPLTNKIEFPLWTMRQIKKSWKFTDYSGKIASKVQSLYKAETPMVAFLRLGPVSSSKSQLMNSLINENHNTFFHRQCPGSSRNQILVDRLVEIAWYYPSGKPTDQFSDCVAFCNLHGDSGINATQRNILTQTSSLNVLLLSTLESGENENMVIIKELWSSETPLIVILTDEGDLYEDEVCEVGYGKYKVSLNFQNQANVSVALRQVISKWVSSRPMKFSLEKITRYAGISVDERNMSCQSGMEAAKNIMRFLEGKDPSTVKELYLPCQGKLWHDWCLKSKEMQRFQKKSEAEISKMQYEMSLMTRKQHDHGFSDLMSLFVGSLYSLSESERKYFLKWIAVLLDDFTLEKLITIRQEYNTKWKQVLDLKKKPDKGPETDQRHFGGKRDLLKSEQSALENISKKLNATTFGLEHLLREMGQIYESYTSEKMNMMRKSSRNQSKLPTFAAELMISGFPLELMDGDTAYVPLTWITAVLHEVINKVGDCRVFVLSVLGIQSSGKSTMLNAMFGLQFAVSAGRCTKGAFMQLVKVSEDLKGKLQFDYILVIDTEGLRALELAGINTIHHDNELATFVVGLGNLTLINIYGENPAEMQEILQIVVHAFLRMKEVNLSPSCMFIHQNVTDVVATEKVMDGRIHLQETLDKMTKLAAKDADCYAENFNDVIEFDVEKDVKYFASLWQGSPPMAPPNPSYSQNIQELKKDILKQASTTNGMRLSEFTQRVKNLWEALLKENFVFSFRNAQEISVYRKLEQEYGKWAWNLRSAMLGIEDKMLNRVASGVVESVQMQDLKMEMASTLKEVQKAFNSFFEEDGDRETLIHWKCKFETQIQDLHDSLISEAKQKVEDRIQQKIILRNLDRQRKDYEKKLFEKSKELALKLKGNVDSENQANKEFDSMWSSWVSEISKQPSVIADVDISKDLTEVLGEFYGHDLVSNQLRSFQYNTIGIAADYTSYVLKNKNIVKKSAMSLFGGEIFKPEDKKSIRDVISKATEQTKHTLELFLSSTQGYNSLYIRSIARDIQTLVNDFELEFKRKRKLPDDASFFKKEFYIDVTLYVGLAVKSRISELHRIFKEANDPLNYFEKKKPEYFNIFHNYYAGATSAAILGVQVCNNLKEPISQSVYNMIAQFVSGQMRGKVPFNGNRADLEKHILKSLAEQTGNKEERFQNYLTYMEQPREHFEKFIKDKVKEFMAAYNPQAVSAIKGCIDHKQKIILSVATMGIDRAKLVKGDTNVWLNFFSQGLADEMGDIRIYHCDEESRYSMDFDILVEVIKKELVTVSEELQGSLSDLSQLRMEKFRERPDDILIKHFCACCWEQCPFCGAVCTNSQRNHPGDHNADFHRTSGMNGVHYRDTNEFFLNFCTVAVASDDHFCPASDYNSTCRFKDYRTAGERYEKWRISTDFSELAYWKWFICEYQENLEKHHNRKFYGRGEIPELWKRYTELHAIESLGLR